jgi:hypothetical protein
MRSGNEATQYVDVLQIDARNGSNVQVRVICQQDFEARFGNNLPTYEL